MHKMSVKRLRDFWKNLTENFREKINGKVEKIFKGSLDLIPSPSPSVKIQIIGGKVCLRCKGKTMLGIANKLLKTKSFALISQANFHTKIFNFTEGEGDRIKSRPSS